MATTVADLMNPELLYLDQDARTDLARGPILSFGITAVPVLDDEHRPIGMVSLRDLAGTSRPEPTGPVDVMESSLGVTEAATQFARTGRHHFVVVDGAGRALGMVSALDVLRALVGEPARHPAPFPAFGKKSTNT